MFVGGGGVPKGYASAGGTCIIFLLVVFFYCGL